MAGIRKIKELFKSRGVDKSIYLSTFILAVFGIIMIGSASVGSVTRYGVTYALKNMISQTVFVIAGAGVMIFIARVFKTRYITYSSSMRLFLLPCRIMSRPLTLSMRCMPLLGLLLI